MWRLSSFTLYYLFIGWYQCKMSYSSLKKNWGGLKRNGNVPSTAVNQIPFFRDRGVSSHWCKILKIQYYKKSIPLHWFCNIVDTRGINTSEKMYRTILDIVNLTLVPVNLKQIFAVCLCFSSAVMPPHLSSHCKMQLKGSIHHIYHWAVCSGFSFSGWVAANRKPGTAVCGAIPECYE